MTIRGSVSCNATTTQATNTQPAKWIKRRKREEILLFGLKDISLRRGTIWPLADHVKKVLKCILWLWLISERGWVMNLCKPTLSH